MGFGNGCVRHDVRQRDGSVRRSGPERISATGSGTPLFRHPSPDDYPRTPKPLRDPAERLGQRIANVLLYARRGDCCALRNADRPR
jgi:hypothetical protein